MIFHFFISDIFWHSNISRLTPLLSRFFCYLLFLDCFFLCLNSLLFIDSQSGIRVLDLLRYLFLKALFFLNSTASSAVVSAAKAGTAPILLDAIMAANNNAITFFFIIVQLLIFEFTDCITPIIL